MKNYSKIVSGTMNWGIWGKNLNTKEMSKLIENYFGIGINCFDHADIYRVYTTGFSFGKSFNENQILLGWISKHPPKIIPVVSSTSIERLKSSVNSPKIEMSTEDWFILLEARNGFKIP